MVYTLGIYYLGLRPLGRISSLMGNHLKAPLNIPDSLTLGTSVWPLPSWRKELAIQPFIRSFFCFPIRDGGIVASGWDGEGRTREMPRN